MNSTPIQLEGKQVFDEKDIMILYPPYINQKQVVVAIKCEDKEKAKKLKFALEQFNWRIFRMIERLEEQAKHSKSCKEPQNFKLHEMLFAEAEQLRVLLRCCDIPEPKENKT